MAPMRQSSRSVPLKRPPANDRAARHSWKGASPQSVGRPAGLSDRAGDTTHTREIEEASRKLLCELGADADDRPRLVKFLPVKESQIILESVPANLYSYPVTVQGEELVYKLHHAEARLVRSVLEQAGFCATESHDWNLLWAGTVPQKYMFEGLLDYQKINHFPSSEELTRKDRLYTNVAKMQEKFGREVYDFLPETFILPEDFSEFSARFREQPDQLWIAKPNASSQGKGIFLVESLADAMVSEPYIVSQYINNPLLINSLKFDMRVYVLVTSYDPMRIYVYEEGLARFASEEYTPTGNKKNRFMHLTNYSVNKKNDRFVQNQDYHKDNVGHKWSLSALFQRLETEGADVDEIWARIYDAIIKSILAIEDHVIESSKELSIGRNNCFDLFGFDVLLDSALKPWILEVNLSPSLATDSPLDLYIKGNLVADTLNLVGVRAFDRVKEGPNRIKARLRMKRFGEFGHLRRKPKLQETWRLKDVLRDTAEEFLRRGHFIRIYPSKGCEVYDQFFPITRPSSKMVMETFGLFPERREFEQVSVPCSDSTPVTPRPGTSLTFSFSTNTLTKLQPQRRAVIPARKRVSTAVSRKVTITGDDILLEYTSRLVAALMKTAESDISKQWRRGIETFLAHSVWRAADQPAEVLWRRVDIKYNEMVSRSERAGRASESEGRAAMQKFTSMQLEEYLRTSTTGVTREVIMPLVGKAQRGVLSELGIALAMSRSSSHAHLSRDLNEDDDQSRLPLNSLRSLSSNRLGWQLHFRRSTKSLKR